MKNNTLPHNHSDKKITDRLSNKLKNTEDFKTAADIFKRLGDTSRIKIYWLLCHCEECVINISALVNMSSPAVSHHLRVLKDKGLIVNSRKGKEVYYKAANTEESLLLHKTIEKILEISCPKE